MIRPLLVLSVGLTLTAAIAAPASAQIVNTQPLLSKAAGEGLSAELRGTVDWRTGNTDLFRTKATLLAFYHHGDHRVISSSKVDLGVVGGADFVSKIFSHLRYQAELSALVTWEVFGQISTAKLKRLTLRSLAGTGPRWTLLPDPDLSLTLGTAYMFEHETLDTGTEADSGRVDDSHRASIYLSTRVALSTLVTLIHTTFYQPKLDALTDDFRIYSDTTVAFAVDKTLALTIGLGLAYDSAPPEGVEGFDSALNFGLALTL